VSLWKRLFGKDDAPPSSEDGDASSSAGGSAATPAATASTAAASSGASEPDPIQKLQQEQIERLARLGKAGGPGVTEALTTLRGSSGSSHQNEVLRTIIAALATAGSELDPLRVACASLLDERGREPEALAMVRDARSVDAMMLAADLHARRGELARAVGAVERVMARAIDTPGARERHERWCAALGRVHHKHSHDDGATVMAAHDEHAASYRLLREVARGGAGAVYQAEDELLGRTLAYKVYHRGAADREQLEREAQTAVRLHGPGVVRVFDADPEQGWIALEWADGGSLRDRLAAARADELLPLLDWLRPLLDALVRVHVAGVVHGDLKPGNVLFAGGLPLLSDFGSASAVAAATVAGTPGYMSPERLGGAATDPRDDVYALGRIIEDALDACDDAGITVAGSELTTVSRIALECLHEAERRPPDAAAVAKLLAPGVG
jgi:serine/threonine-protein kinase